MSLFLLPGDRSASSQQQSQCVGLQNSLSSLDVPWRMLSCGESPQPCCGLTPQPGAAFLSCLCRWAAEMGVRLNTWLEPARGGGVSFSLQFIDYKNPPSQHFPSFSVESLDSAAEMWFAGEAGEHTCHPQDSSSHAFLREMKHHITSVIHDQNPCIFRLVMTEDKSAALEGGAESERKVIPFLPPLPLSRS